MRLELRLDSGEGLAKRTPGEELSAQRGRPRSRRDSVSSMPKEQHRRRLVSEAGGQLTKGLGVHWEDSTVKSTARL